MVLIESANEVIKKITDKYTKIKVKYCEMQ